MKTHDETTRIQAPRSSMMGYGRQSTWRCALCFRLSASQAGRRLKRVQGLRTWVCKGCSEKAA